MPLVTPEKNQSQWTFLTNHAHVLLCIARTPGSLMRDLAREIGITERAVQRIIGDLIEAGYLSAERHGRRNRYRVQIDLPLRHPIEAHRSVASLIKMLHGSRPTPKSEAMASAVR